MHRSIQLSTKIQYFINNREFIDSHKKISGAFTRSRKLTFATVVSTILHLAKRSLQIECDLLGERQMSDPASKQAFSMARYKISYVTFKALNDEVLNGTYIDNSEGLFHGYRVFGTDGSTIRLPESKENEEYFSRHNSGGLNKGKDPIIARISEVIDLTSGMIVNADIGPLVEGERVLAEKQIKSVVKLFHSFNQEKLLFIYDRGYLSKEWIKMHISLKADFIFRVPRKFNKKIDSLISSGECDCLIKLGGEIPTLRLTIKKLPSGENCILLTSLINESEMSIEDLMSLYWLRWSGCEEGYKRQKVALELENFSGKGVEAVLQEFWATVLIVNLFQLHCFENEGAWDLENPPEKRINRSVVFGSMREMVFKMIMGELSAIVFSEKFSKIANRSKVKVRPGRQYPRNNLKKEKHVFRRVC